MDEKIGKMNAKTVQGAVRDRDGVYILIRECWNKNWSPTIGVCSKRSGGTFWWYEQQQHPSRSKRSGTDWEGIYTNDIPSHTDASAETVELTSPVNLPTIESAMITGWQGW